MQTRSLIAAVAACAVLTGACQARDDATAEPVDEVELVLTSDASDDTSSGVGSDAEKPISTEAAVDVPAVETVAHVDSRLRAAQTEIGQLAVVLDQSGGGPESVAVVTQALLETEEALDASTVRALGPGDRELEAMADSIDELDREIIRVLAIIEQPGDPDAYIIAIIDAEAALAAWEEAVAEWEAAWEQAALEWEAEWEAAAIEWEAAWEQAALEWEAEWEAAAIEWEAEWQRAAREWEAAWQQAAAEWEAEWQKAAQEAEAEWQKAAEEWEAEWQRAAEQAEADWKAAVEEWERQAQAAGNR